ncbi:15-methylpalmitoyl-4-hydroxy-2-pyrone 4-O-methyltransferase [Salsuginibacillus halophilus]|uniref:15-methylpalmitoyl-4-hydroxy-2-pyrone 4-O-methyltransferase n=1 Tax=Salsuginibacillus halophilus TaxID=517424 RepID=A0A2P8HLD4_9BACI|nr:isoprenylcysteine carboxylmethyltransferase family protein [Salsuginibacillus halophilus]PSL47029.1 15-methylpalmitoyl-4-hydroxy-2-pyrone 4-O-methyltransferase [Salsuginibacillus halophilus]
MFWFVFSFVVVQRVFECLIAKQNERWAKRRGAVEAGKAHYPAIVAMHIAFFLALFVEVILLNTSPPAFWLLPLLLFIAAQVLRVWALTSLGRFWNTKIFVIPGAVPVKRGPYRLMRHPNYWVVALEILALPLLFGAYTTAVVFTLLNAYILLVHRIPAEEAAWREAGGNDLTKA